MKKEKVNNNNNNSNAGGKTFVESISYDYQFPSDKDVFIKFDF